MYFVLRLFVLDLRRRTQVVRERSAKPLFSGSSPLVASSSHLYPMNTTLVFLENSCLTEEQVIDAVCRWLIPQWEIVSTCSPKEQGDDIVATRLEDGATLFIEAKGSTSSMSNSSRFGLPFTPQQIRSHVGAALRKTAEVVSREAANTNARIAIALAYTHDQHAVVERIKPALKLWNVGLMWVYQDGSVDVDLAWDE